MSKNDDAYYEGLDKRSREYKTWKAGRESVGLGDTVKKVIDAVVPDKILRKVADKDCGCKERQAKLNELFRYQEKPLCLESNQIEDWGTFMNTRNMRLIGNGKAIGKLSASEVTFVCEMFSVVFRRQLWQPQCSSCAGSVKTLIAMIYKMDTVYTNSI